MEKAVLWSIRRPHTDNIKNGNKWDEIRKRIPKDLSILTRNFIYETKANGGCGKVIGEFRVSQKTYIYADIDENGTKHLYNTALIMPAISDEDLFNYLYDGKQNSGWALRISKLKIYENPKDLSEFRKPQNILCDYGYGRFNEYEQMLTRPPQSWCYIKEF